MTKASLNPEPIISVSGLRGVIGTSLTPDRVIRYVAAYASTRHGKIVVTRDGRSSGEMVAQWVCSTLQATGCEVLDGGIAATPTTGRLVRQHQAAGGIQISFEPGSPFSAAQQPVSQAT